MTTFWLILVFLVCVWFLHPEVFKLYIFKPSSLLLKSFWVFFLLEGPIPSKDIKVFFEFLNNWWLLFSCFMGRPFLASSFSLVDTDNCANNIIKQPFSPQFFLLYGYYTIIHSWNLVFDTDLFSISISIYVKIYSDYSSLLSFFSPKNVPGETI